MERLLVRRMSYWGDGPGRQGEPFGERDGEQLIGYMALDTKEVVWIGTLLEIIDWAGQPTGTEPFDRHLDYWERRYRARRFNRRLGNLPTYTDLYEAAWRVLDNTHPNGWHNLEDLMAALDHLRSVVGERERV